MRHFLLSLHKLLCAVSTQTIKCQRSFVKCHPMYMNPGKIYIPIFYHLVFFLESFSTLHFHSQIYIFVIKLKIRSGDLEQIFKIILVLFSLSLRLFEYCFAHCFLAKNFESSRYFNETCADCVRVKSSLSLRLLNFKKKTGYVTNG